MQKAKGLGLLERHVYENYFQSRNQETSRGKKMLYESLKGK